MEEIIQAEARRAAPRRGSRRWGQGLLSSAGTGIALALASPAYSVDFHLGELQAKVSGTLSAGTMMRTEDASPEVYGSVAAARVGAPAGYLIGNQGSSDLNFKKDRPVSSVLKASVDFDISRNNLGIFTRTSAWYDDTLKNGGRAYGNTLNGFARDVPLGDDRFDAEAKFANARVEEVYAYGRFKTDAGGAIETKLGRQIVSWGVAQMTGGGINALNPVDLPAINRPGALAKEARLPVGMAYAKLGVADTWGVEAALPYEFRPNVLNGCGTFFGNPNYAPVGCDYVSVISSINDATTLANGYYPKRQADVLARDSGQLGLSAHYRAAALATDLRFYVMNYHSRTPSIRVSNPNIAGTPGNYGPAPAAAPFARLSDPNGLKYALIYAEDIHLFGASFDSELAPTLRTYGELAIRPNQSLNINASDLIAAFVARSPLSALNLARNSNALPAGASFDGYDRYRVSTATLGLSKAFAGALGAQRLTLTAEVGWSQVSGLPSAGKLRYGRSDDYGQAAVTGGTACVDNSLAKKSCALDGFVTGNAWGYRLRVAAAYPDAIAGATLRPSLYVAQDVSGYSYDGSFLKGRSVLRPALRAEWNKRYYTEAQYTRISGGNYNNFSDRDNVTLVVGVNF